MDIEEVKKVCLSDKHMLTIKKEISNNGMLSFLINRFKFINKFKISQIIYHLKNDIYNEVKCKMCDNFVRYIDINNGYVKYCSNTCQLNDYWSNVSIEDIANRTINRKKTCISKYGVDNYTKTIEYLEKSKKTNLEKYGTEYHLKTEESKIKIKNTLINKYGVDNISKVQYLKDKKREKSLSKNEVEKNLIREKYRNTILSRYGVDHLSQDSDFLENVLKKSFSYKSYRLPSGKVISLQGYEPQVMDFLLLKYNEYDIFYKNRDIEDKIGKIFYQFNGKKSRYFPDLYVLSDNKVIEVKSTYTYNLDLERNLLKRQECINMGISFEFIIYDNINKTCIIK